jgi:hypothetical protein
MLALEAAQLKEWRGVCTKQASITFVPPVYVNCPKCKRVTLLFDPLIHGCQAETKTASDDEGECKLVKCAITPGKVLVSYTCTQNENNYLSADTTENTEYYLNTLSVFYGDISIIWQACNDMQKQAKIDTV